MPLREVGEKILGANVYWDSNTKSATLTLGNNKVVVQIGSSNIYINDRAAALDAPAYIDNSLTYVPLRAIAEGFGLNVGYNNGTITINSNSSDNNEYMVTDLPQLQRAQTGDTIAVMHTNYGDMSFRLFPEYAPLAVENFITHSKDGYYNGVIFHRVINNFVIQAGDPTGTGMGGESIWGDEFEDEFSPNLRNFRGALCMANAGPDTNGSQFYIVQERDASQFTSEIEQFAEQPVSNDLNITYSDIYPQNVLDSYKKLGGYPSLDFGYTVFGQIEDGMDVVDKIAAVKTNDLDKPVEDIIIYSIDITTK